MKSEQLNFEDLNDALEKNYQTKDEDVGSQLSEVFGGKVKKGQDGMGGQGQGEGKTVPNTAEREDQ
jgi:hypothetical protein